VSTVSCVSTVCICVSTVGGPSVSTVSCVSTVSWLLCRHSCHFLKIDVTSVSAVGCVSTVVSSSVSTVGCVSTVSVCVSTVAESSVSTVSVCPLSVDCSVFLKVDENGKPCL